MAIILFTLLVFYLLYRIFRQKRTVPPPSAPVRAKSPPTSAQPSQSGSDPEWLVQTHVRLLQRKTYIKGTLIAKFRGELDYIKNLEQFVRERYFDITLYDAQVINAHFRRNNDGAFPDCGDNENAPLAIDPNPLPCSISYQEITGSYSILLHDVRLSKIDFNKYRLLHMEEDDLVFGTVEATITGYLLEDFREECQVNVPVSAPGTIGSPTPAILTPVPAPEPMSAFTGNTKTAKGYRWQEYLNADRDSTLWANPVYTRRDQPGCLGSVGIVFLAFFSIVFLLAIGAQGIYLLLVLAACGLVVGFFSGFFRPALWLLTAIMLLMGIASFFRMLVHGSDIRPVAFARNRSNEISFVVQERNKSKDSAAGIGFDSLIIHHRVWKDYNDSSYEGDIRVRTSDLAKSAACKNHLVLPKEPLVAYDGMLNALQAGDRALLTGVYGLMDSIRISHHLDSVGFAKTVVSFVQDIPYALVLDRDCNPDLYHDPFIRSYLQTDDAACSGFQRFGINTPVEFMGTLQGDCDTRTLFLYTLLDHYGYDVAILSSELYSHSLLGIVLPMEGANYPFHHKHYVIWETTAPQMPPGFIDQPYSNLTNWRISLTSKN